MTKSLLFSLALAAVTASGAWAQTALPYSIDFTKTAEGWAAADNNADGNTWVFYTGAGIGFSTNTNAAEDDWVSPAFTLKKGTSYNLSATLAATFSGEGDKVSLAVSSDKKTWYDVAELTVPEIGPAETKATYTPTEAGTYYFSFHNTSAQSAYGSILYATVFSISEGESGSTTTPGEEVYSTNFSGSNPLDGWTTADANSDNATWGSVSGIAGATYNSASAKGAADDWLFSPALKLTEGQDYLVEYTFAQQGAFDPDKVEVKAGTAAEASAMTAAIATESIDANASTVTATRRFTATKTGDTFLGFHVATANNDNGQLSLRSLKVTAAEKATPQAVTDLAGTPDNNSKTVTLTWTNPTLDTKGTPISQPLSVKVYENDQEVGQVDNQEAGAKGTFTYVPETFSGVVTYSVKAVLGENESEAAKVEVNLADEQGELVLVKSFADLNSTSAQDWVIEDVAGNSKWQYDYQNVFTFVYKLAQKDEEWLISPAIAMEKGTRYVLKYELKTALNYSTSIDVTVGNAQTHTAQTFVAASYPDLKQNGFGEYESAQFSVEETGNHYIGFRVYDTHNTTSMRNLAIYRISSTSGVEEEVAAPAAYYSTATATLYAAAGSRIAVYDLRGSLVDERISDGRADLSQLPKGFYVVKATDAEGNTTTLKIVK